MFIRWKERRLKTLPSGDEWDYCFHNVSAELLESYRNPDGKIKQRYIASLGSFKNGNYKPPDRSLVTMPVWPTADRFWTSVWKKLFELKCKSEDLEKIEAILAKRVPMPRYCHWHPKYYRTFNKWNSNFEYDISCMAGNL